MRPHIMAPTEDRALLPRTPSARSLVFRETATIHAGVDRVWRILVDLTRYAEWNPWLVRAEGALEPGGVVWANVVMGKRRMRAKHVVLVVEHESRLVWRDAGWSSALVYGQRARTLTPQPDGTVVLNQELMVEGPLKNVAARGFGAAMRDGLAAETLALKRQAEAAPRTAASRAIQGGIDPLL